MIGSIFMSVPAYSLINAVVQGKIDNLNEYESLSIQEANIALHHNQSIIDKAMERIMDENPKFNISYKMEINCLSLKVSRV